MSVETHRALDAAIAAHFADECGGATPTGYVVQIAGVSFEDLDNGQTQYLRSAPEGQDIHVTAGLYRYGSRWIDIAITAGEGT